MSIPGTPPEGLGSGMPLRLSGPGQLLRLAHGRASGAAFFDAAGVLQNAAADVPRFAGGAARLLLEGQRSNGVRNPRAEGTAGANPINWQLFAGSLAGVVRSVSSWSSGGLSGIDMTLDGLCNATSTLPLSFETSSAIAASAGQSWTQSVFLACTRGSPAELVLTGAMRVADSGGTLLSSTAVTGAAAPAPATLTRHVVSGVLPASPAGTAFVTPSIRLILTAGVTYAHTLRFAFPQMEQGAMASSPILPAAGAPAAATRAADLVTAGFGTLFPGGSGTLLLGGLLPQAAPAGGSDLTLLQMDNGSASNAIQLRQPTGGSGFIAGRVLSGVAANTAATAAFTPGSAFALGLAFDAAGLSLLLRGDSEKALATSMPTGLTTLRLGAGLAGAAAMFGEVGALACLPYRASAAEMALRLTAF